MTLMKLLNRQICLKNKYAIVLLIGIVFNIIGFFWFYNTIYYDSKQMEYKFKVSHEWDIWKYQYEVSHYNNYFGGMWLIFSCMIFICLLLFFDFPSYSEIFKRLKKDIKKKMGINPRY
jgi:hypothetical protein